MGYSAKVVLQLIAGGQVLSLSHVGAGQLVVRGECPHIQPGPAALIIEIDDNVSEQAVYLPDGIKGGGVPATYRKEPKATEEP